MGKEGRSKTIVFDMEPTGHYGVAGLADRAQLGHDHNAPRQRSRSAHRQTIIEDGDCVLSATKADNTSTALLYHAPHEVEINTTANTLVWPNQPYW